MRNTTAEIKHIKILLKQKQLQIAKYWLIFVKENYLLVCEPVF